MTGAAAPAQAPGAGRDAWRLCVAPMMDWTDRHCRWFHRLLAPHARLYSEMVHAGAILHGDRRRLLDFDPAERPLALQLGGSDPDDLARAAEFAAAWGYDEINLNCGCPSERVQRGAFGAVLMREPQRVAACVRAMAAASGLAVSVKCRIGVDDEDDEPFLQRFVERVAAAGCRVFHLHARKAWLSGLSPKQNRAVPPLRYDRVHRLAAHFPELVIVLNGGLCDPERDRAHLDHVDGLMIGRAAYQDPWLLTRYEEVLFAHRPAHDRVAVVQRMADYAARQARNGVPLKAVARHMLGLFNGLPGARRWRRTLGEGMHRPNASPDLLLQALHAAGYGQTLPEPYPAPNC